MENNFLSISTTNQMFAFSNVGFKGYAFILSVVPIGKINLYAK